MVYLRVGGVIGRSGVNVHFTVLHRGARDIEPLSANGSILDEEENEKEGLIGTRRSFRVLRCRDQPSSIIEIVLEETADGR